jgi:NTP pyrophosphatase (non-canonical NTP hydrolase)
MKITICSSIDFTPEIIEIKKRLEVFGHEVKLPYFTEKIIGGEVSYEEYMKSKERDGDILLRKSQPVDLIMRHRGLVVESDAILVLNMKKKGVDGYIGGNALMEMGFAYAHGKKIFLFNPVPERSERMHYVDEILDMKPVVIDGDLSKIGGVKEGAYVSLKEIAGRSREIQEEIGLTFDDVLNKFTQETGELNDAIQKRRGRFCKTKALNDDSVKDELGDVMFNLISICERLNIDPEELPLLAKNTLNKFKERKELYKENLQ